MSHNSQLHYGFQAIALFNANQHEDAMQRVQELAADCPNADALACRIVKVGIMPTRVHASLTLIFMNFAHQAYLHVQLGINALDGARHNEAAGHFTAAVNAGASVSDWAIQSTMYEDFVVVR